MDNNSVETFQESCQRNKMKCYISFDCYIIFVNNYIWNN